MIHFKKITGQSVFLVKKGGGFRKRPHFIGTLPLLLDVFLKRQINRYHLICWNWRLATKYFIFLIARIAVLCTGVMLVKEDFIKRYSAPLLIKVDSVCSVYDISKIDLCKYMKALSKTQHNFFRMMQCCCV